MVDVGLIIGAIAIVLAIVAIGLGGYALTKLGSGGTGGAKGPPGPPGPPGITGASGLTGGSGTNCTNGPTCPNLVKLKLFLNYMDIINNQLVFKQQPLFDEGLKIPLDKKIDFGENMRINCDGAHIIFGTQGGCQCLYVRQDSSLYSRAYRVQNDARFCTLQN